MTLGWGIVNDWPDTYYAVIFSSQHTSDTEGYAEMGQRTVELAQQQPGFLGVESARGADGFGITVSYWESEEAIRAWKAQVDHLEAQRLGKERWYSSYHLRVAVVTREYARSKAEDPE